MADGERSGLGKCPMNRSGGVSRSIAKIANFNEIAGHPMSLELFPDADFGAVGRVDRTGCMRPIGQRGTGRARRRRATRPLRPSSATAIAELRQVVQQQHAELVDEIRRLGRYQLDERESLPALLRRVTEIERVLKLTELHIPPSGHTPRRPLGR